MKKRILQCLSLVLCAVLLSIPAAAAETEEETPARPGPVAYWGTVTWMGEDSFLVNPGEADDLSQAVVVHAGDAPCLDAVTGNTLNLDTLEDGDTVYVWVGPAMMLSMPPQSAARLILGNIPADYAVPQYYEITGSVITEASAVLSVAGSNDTVTVPASAQVSPYLTRNLVTLADLVPGTRILVWSDAKGTPEKVLVFAYEYRGYVAAAEDGTVSVNGAAVDQKAKTTADGDTLLPIRAVAEALGMNVRWDAAQGAVVSYGEDMVKPAPLESETLMTALPGGAITAVDSDGTAEEVYGACVIENGVTYVSMAALAQALDLYRAD